jgi:hypothetical protein
MRIGLVGCVKQKLPVAAPARDLYVSPLFRGRRRYVETTCDDWFILSAKHGLVDKHHVLDPYDVTLKTASTGQRRRWSREVLDGLRSRLGDLVQHTFEVHAGSEYRDYGLHAGLVAAGATVEIPTAGLGMGSQLAFYGSDSDPRPDSTPQPQAPPTERPAGSGRGSYSPLGDHLRRLDVDEVALAFAEVERILGRPLPRSARRHRAWWANERSGTHSHARAWLEAGWRVDAVNLAAEWVRFRR